MRQSLKPNRFGADTTQCTYDVTNTALNVGQNAGTYMWAMRAFAQCAATQPQAPGYCHGALRSASMLANHDVCEDGSNTNIGFHSPSLPILSSACLPPLTRLSVRAVRIPFNVIIGGTYTFRLHADYGYVSAETVGLGR